MKVLLLGRVNAGRDMCVGKLHLLIFTWKTWPMSRSLNSTPGPLLRRLFTYHSFQLEEQRNAKNVPKFSFKSALALYALRTCRWPPKARLVCGLALARPQLCYITFSTCAKVYMGVWDPILCRTRGAFLLSNIFMNKRLLTDSKHCNWIKSFELFTQGTLLFRDLRF